MLPQALPGDPQGVFRPLTIALEAAPFVRSSEIDCAVTTVSRRTASPVVWTVNAQKPTCDRLDGAATLGATRQSIGQQSL
jgi:hypothetical protein